MLGKIRTWEIFVSSVAGYARGSSLRGNRPGRLCSILAGWLLLAGAAPALRADMSVSLDPSDQAPVQVGTVVRWDTTVLEADEGTLWYRYRVRSAGSDFRIVRDYGPDSALEWTANEHEGDYEIEVSVRNQETGETVTTYLPYQFASRVSADQPVISPTRNPLVFLYSAPPCPAGSRMRVQFQSAGGAAQNTPTKACTPDRSMNFYLAGMRANTSYSARHTVESGALSWDGPTLSVTTPDGPIPDTAVIDAAVEKRPPGPAASGVLLQASLSKAPLATDLDGNVVWFYPGDANPMTRPGPGGHFFLIIQQAGEGTERQLLREIDLAGVVIVETNAARINEQLLALGMNTITAFHHEARRLQDGTALVLANTERILTDVQGPGPVDVLGDMILVLDSDLQVIWAWDAFDHLDPYRQATLKETCAPDGGGCPPFYLAPLANDWLHGNSLQLTPDGNILYSARHQDWLIKIDYRDGAGAGDVIWRLGKDGDFRLESADPSPWFSHQHDAGFQPGDNSTLGVFDNGNVRYAQDVRSHSRGQVLRLDERNRVATLLLNADLGDYSRALGSAQLLPNGNYHFNVGWTSDNLSLSVEVNPSGQIVYAVKLGATEYRTFRMRDLYTP